MTTAQTKKQRALLIQKASVLREQIEQLIVDIRAMPGEDVDAAVCADLGPSVALLGKILIKGTFFQPDLLSLDSLLADLHQKAGEVVFKKENTQFEILPQNHGADLRDKKGGLWEHKETICRERQTKCNFNFPVPKGATEEARREALLKSIRAKTAGGGLMLQIRNGRMEVKHQYILDAEIAEGYFSRITLGKCGNHNLGCARCKDCKEYHRLDALVALQKKKDRNEKLTKADWAKAMAKCDANCGIKKQ